MKPVFIRPSADSDLDDIFSWIARDDPIAAERLIGRIIDAAIGLGPFPEKGRRRPELGEDVRSIVIGKYVILYQSEPASVNVVRIVHGAREIGALLASDDSE